MQHQLNQLPKQHKKVKPQKPNFFRVSLRSHQELPRLWSKSVNDTSGLLWHVLGQSISSILLHLSNNYNKKWRKTTKTKPSSTQWSGCPASYRCAGGANYCGSSRTRMSSRRRWESASAVRTKNTACW